MWLLYGDNNKVIRREADKWAILRGCWTKDGVSKIKKADSDLYVSGSTVYKQKGVSGTYSAMNTGFSDEVQHSGPATVTFSAIGFIPFTLYEEEEMRKKIKDAFVCVAIETTGDDPSVDKVTQISASRIINGERQLDTFNVFIRQPLDNPDIPTKLVMDFYGKDLPDAVREFRAFIGGQALVFFDESKNTKAFMNGLLGPIGNFMVDAYELAKDAGIVDEGDEVTIESIAFKLGIPWRDCYRAQNRAILLAESVPALFESDGNQAGQLCFC